ncbi:glycosyltransferase, partial [Clostridium perfringens]
MKISVIVPVYNVEEYISKCIDSILNQTINEQFEIIVVNDGSTDNSMNILNIYKDKIKIVNKSNGGLSSARNAGLEIAKGEYIIFVDSDDWLEEDFLESLYNFIKKDDLDVVFSGYKVYRENGNITKVKCVYSEDIILNKDKAIEKLLSKRTFRAEVWDDIYNREFLMKNKLFFTEGIINEDEDFTLRVLINSKKVGYLNYNGYIYRQRDGSITKTINYKKIIESRILILDNLIKLFYHERNSKIREFIFWRIKCLFIGLLKNIKDANLEYDINNIFKF